MSTRPLGHILVAIASALILLALVGQSLATVQAARQHAIAGNMYVVDSTADTVDADVANPACADASDQCTLRAAIMQANFVTGLDTITLPSGVYLLTRSGNDDAALVGDLDIADDLTIQGVGAGATIIDGNGAVINDRVFHVLRSPVCVQSVSMSALTIRNGRAPTTTFEPGGGLYHVGSGCSGGSNLSLSDVVVEGNTAYDGGGLFVNGTVFTLTRSIVRANTAFNGGGLRADTSVPIIRDSQVYSNSATQWGGGLMFDQGGSFLPCLFGCLERTEIYSNTANSGGGLYNRDSVSVLTLVDSYVHHNHARYDGGGIDNEYGGLLVISRTVLEANTADILGGGIRMEQVNRNGTASVQESTLSRNTAQYGGAIYAVGGTTTILNSTLSSNGASHDGGGIYAMDTARVLLYNATIASNRLNRPTGQIYPARGGGVFITTTAIITAQNTLIGDNARVSGLIQPVPDDCFVSPTTSLHSLGYNLVETTTNCFISGLTFGNVNQDPKLGPLQNNGGSTPTQALMVGSPAIDAGHPSGCTYSIYGISYPLMTDQRWFRRPIGTACDIGAFEHSPFALDLPLIQR